MTRTALFIAERYLDCHYRHHSVKLSFENPSNANRPYSVKSRYLSFSTSRANKKTRYGICGFFIFFHVFSKKRGASAMRVITFNALATDIN